MKDRIAWKRVGERKGEEDGRKVVEEERGRAGGERDRKREETVEEGERGWKKS